MDFWRGIKTVAPQLDPLAVGELHRFGKTALFVWCVYDALLEQHFLWLAAIGFGQTLGDVVFHLQSGSLCGAAIQVCAAGCCGGAGVGDFVGIAAADAHLRV